MAITNAEIGRRFLEVADLLEIEGANPFRVRAYRNAARVVAEHPERLDRIARRNPEALKELPGIGDDLAAKIVELSLTGRLDMLGRLAEVVPPGVAELMRVPGIGPRRARQLHEALNIRSVAQLERAVRAHKVRELPGFGERTETRLLEALAARSAEGEGEGRVLRSSVVPLAESLVAALSRVPGVERCEVAGSFRRGRETVADLDLVAAAPDDARVIDAFCALPQVDEVVAGGGTKATVRIGTGLQVDLRVVPPESYGTALHYFTGSKAHNIALRRRAQLRGLRLNEYGLYNGNERLAGRTEEELYAAFGLPWIPPELREDTGEFEAAERNALPRLVELADIRGDLQTHSTDSDGRDSIETMASAADALGYDYLAVTDHTPAVRVTGGMDAAGFRRQAQRIDRLNAKLTRLRVLKGAEVDILADGSLDLPDEALAALDIVLVTFHSHFTLPAQEQTRRLVRAVSHPRVMILGHPMGRRIGHRAPAVYDFPTVAKACAEHGVAMEIDGQPERLDLDEVRARQALEAGVKFMVSSDAHATSELGYMRWGVTQARRGWLQARDVLNTLPLEGLMRALAR
jgi:DNA polymerase (family 10)